MHAHRIALAIGCLLLMAFSVSARQIEDWTYDRLFHEANLVVIAAAEETITTEDQLSEKDQDETYVGQETTFQVRRILKGSVEGGVKPRVLHYRLPNGKLAQNGPLFVVFRHDELELKGIINGIAFARVLPPPDYLLFLRVRPDGRYEPISGRVDPAFSVREVSSIDDFLLPKIAEISDKKPNTALDSTATGLTTPAGQDDASRQREQIGESLGKPVYRDEIRTEEGVPLTSELHRLFTSAAIQEYREQHKVDITPTPTEIAAATKHYDKGHRERMREQEPDLQAKLKAIDEKLAAVNLQETEKGKFSIERRAIEGMMTPPGEFFATFALTNLKFQRHLYLKYGGGRILFQQAGLESFDATRKWLESLEEAGKFKITDPKLRSVFYHYYIGQDHGVFLSRKEEVIREITEPIWLEQPKPQK